MNDLILNKDRDKMDNSSIDQIVIGSGSQVWLQKKNLLPSAWKLNQEEISRILTANIYLTITCSPASELKIPDSFPKCPFGGHLILLDVNCCVDLTREEIIALVL